MDVVLVYLYARRKRLKYSLWLDTWLVSFHSTTLSPGFSQNDTNTVPPAAIRQNGI